MTVLVLPLPSRNRFEYGGTAWVTDLPARPWTPGDSTFGGTPRQTASGIPAVDHVRRDQLIFVTLRIWEGEWPALRDFIRWAQGMEPFGWMPDVDGDDTYLAYLEQPAAGSRWGFRHLPDFPRVVEVDLVLRAVVAELGTRDYFTPGGEAGPSFPQPPASGAPPDSPSPNEPGSYLPLIDEPFESLAGWSTIAGPWASVALAEDITSPRSSPSIVRTTYQAGQGAGPFPVKDFSFDDQAEFYLRCWFRCNAPMTKHPSAVDKMLLLGTNGRSPGGTHNNEVVFALHGLDSATMRMVATVQAPSQTSPEGMLGSYFYPNINPAPGLWPLGFYNELEARLIMNSFGQANGVLTWWVNGTLIGHHTHVIYSPDGNGAVLSLRWQHYRGGDPAAMTIAQAETIDDAHLIASGLPADGYLFPPP